jgi:hypothetical protein
VLAMSFLLASGALDAGTAPKPSTTALRTAGTVTFRQPGWFAWANSRCDADGGRKARSTETPGSSCCADRNHSRTSSVWW